MTAMRRRVMSRIGAGLCAALCSAAAADGAVLREPAALYDSHSSRSTPLLILSAGHPLREVSRVDGWRKVSLFTGESGWVREPLLRGMRAAVVLSEIAAARASPSSSAAEVFYARRGIALEVLREETNGWLEVMHKDGETGHVIAADVWTNY